LRWRRIAGHCRGHALIILRMIIIINNENKKLRVLRAAHQAGRKKKKHALRRALQGITGGGYF
ncbi:TPA: hypothetical protein ACQVKN_000522, partial [Serratia marcescens]